MKLVHVQVGVTLAGGREAKFVHSFVVRVGMKKTWPELEVAHLISPSDWAIFISVLTECAGRAYPPLPSELLTGLVGIKQINQKGLK